MISHRQFHRLYCPSSPSPILPCVRSSSFFLINIPNCPPSSLPTTNTAADITQCPSRLLLRIFSRGWQLVPPPPLFFPEPSLSLPLVPRRPVPASRMGASFSPASFPTSRSAGVPRTRTVPRRTPLPLTPRASSTGTQLSSARSWRRSLPSQSRMSAWTSLPLRTLICSQC